MRQTTLTSQLRLSRATQNNGIESLLGLLEHEDELAFHAVIQHGSMLKCISELLMRCAPHISLTVESSGLSFVACDPASGRLIHIVLMATDMGGYRFARTSPMRCVLDSNSLHAVFHQLKRKDTVVLYATASGTGCIFMLKMHAAGDSLVPWWITQDDRTTPNTPPLPRIRLDH